MRQWLVLVLGCAALMACSSTPKKDMAPAPATPAAATATPAKAEAAKTTAGGKMECTLKKEKRDLEVRAKNKGCELAYTKGGKESVVASSVHGSAYCEKAMEKLASKLKTAGYNCN